MMETHDDPRNSPRNSPTVEIRPALSMMKYSCFFSIINSLYLKFKKKMPLFLGAYLRNFLPFWSIFSSETSKLVVLQGLTHFLVLFSSGCRIFCNWWNSIVSFSSSSETFLHMFVSLKEPPILLIDLVHPLTTSSSKAH